ncbi:TorF family putative porin [Sphingomonas sp. A2-49]|uniref:TorF family putative porin n=1 Tax=Sphingomonas sp. A2-49 TaxID=1391375 RepID=UPI0021D1780E|nr:TorF family putative porin [Sphingomonas sp. A2-49]MCU6455344.1 TorF family putative porin [Sphingomonas sp. A2-49]
MKYLSLAAASLAAFVALPAAAQETAPPKAVTVTGSVGLVSDYRFRGVSQSDKQLAVQGGITIAHESGFYIGTWGSNLAGWGTFGGANMELDLIAGYKLPVGGGTLDVGATWYMYPGGFDNTDFIEPYAKLSGTVGPVGLTAGVAYAPKQEALGAWYANGAAAANGVYTKPGDKNDNLYVWGDVSSAVPNTGLTLKAHVGYSKGNDGLGPFATSVAPTGEYADWLLGADYAIAGTPLTIGVAYVDTDISKSESAYLQPSFSKGQDGTGTIAGATALFSLTAAF